MLLVFFYLNFSFNFSLSLPTGADDCYLIIYYLSVSLVIFRYLVSVLQFQLTAFQRIRGPFVLVFCSILGSPRLSLMLGHPSRGGEQPISFSVGLSPCGGATPHPQGAMLVCTMVPWLMAGTPTPQKFGSLLYKEVYI